MITMDLIIGLITTLGLRDRFKRETFSTGSNEQNVGIFYPRSPLHTGEYKLLES